MSAIPQTAPAEKAGWAEVLSVYLRRRVLVIMLLGFSGGLPLALSGSTLLLWMRETGIDLGTIGLFALVGTPYTVKFLWAPLVDALDVPLFSRLLGRRRGWLMLTQLALMAAIVFLALCDPSASPWLVALAALLVATASATQDIVIDAFRVEGLPESEQAAGVASYVAAYRIGMLASTAGALFLVTGFEAYGLARPAAWTAGYLAMAALLTIGIATTLAAREPEKPEHVPFEPRHPSAHSRESGNPGGGGDRLGPRFRGDERMTNSLSSKCAPTGDSQHASSAHRSGAARVFAAALGALRDFRDHEAVAAILAFVVLFKLTDALAGVMTAPFVIDLGFSRDVYATIIKVVGLAATLAGGFAGGFVARALPLSTSLWIGGAVQAAANLAFSWQAMIGADVAWLTFAIVVENFTSAIGTVIFVAYLSALCRNPLHTATQYALLTALAAVGRTYLSSGAGFIAAAAGWPAFFAICALAAAPGLGVLAYLQRRGHFAALGAK
jgi:MFS transporter, PAT family, beta-lactamase induction signal transducer AmpG